MLSSTRAKAAHCRAGDLLDHTDAIVYSTTTVYCTRICLLAIGLGLHLRLDSDRPIAAHFHHHQSSFIINYYQFILIVIIIVITSSSHHHRRHHFIMSLLDITQSRPHLIVILIILHQSVSIDSVVQWWSKHYFAIFEILMVKMCGNWCRAGQSIVITFCHFFFRRDQFSIADSVVNA